MSKQTPHRLASPFRLITLLVLCLVGVRARAQDFNAVFDAYLAGYWKANPGLATVAGVHAYDSLLPDFSPLAVQAEAARNRDFLSRFEQLSKEMNGAAAPQARADLEVVLNHVRLAVLQSDDLHAAKMRPDLVVSALSDSVRVLAVREFGPAERRFEAADARMKLLPKTLQLVRANFDVPSAVTARRTPTKQAVPAPGVAIHPSRYSTQAAIAASRSAADFIEKRVPELAAEQGSSSKLQKRVNRDANAAAVAFRDFARWLETTLLPVSDGTAFLPADVYARWFRDYLAVNEKPAELLKAAQDDLDRTLEEMRRLAETIAPGRSLPDVVNALGQEHPDGRTLLSAYQAASAQAQRFVEEKKLVPLPHPERLRIDRAPTGFPAGRATLEVPGPFEPDLTFAFYTPNLDRLSVEAGDQALFENNSASILLVAIHELFPGHYVQLDLMNRAGNLPQKVFPNPAFVSGWAAYAEQMMLEEGFNNQPAVRLMELLRVLRAEAAAVADISLHTGAMKPEQAADFLATQGLLSKESATEQVASIAMNPAAAAADYAGKRALLQLREDVRKKQGPAFALTEFHEHLISLGAPPLPASRAILFAREELVNGGSHTRP